MFSIVISWSTNYFDSVWTWFTHASHVVKTRSKYILDIGRVIFGTKTAKNFCHFPWTSYAHF